MDPAPHRVQLVSVSDGVQLELLDFGGSGRAIVLLAGLGNTAHVFDEFAPKLTHLGHVYALTRRGYGASSRPESGYDVSRLGEDVLAVLTSVGIDKPVLIGHSLAGQEMSYLAVQHRERIAGLVYLDAAYRYAYDVPGEFEKDFRRCHLPRRRRRRSRDPFSHCPRPSAVSRVAFPRRRRRSWRAAGSSPMFACRCWPSSPARTTLALPTRIRRSIDSMKR